MTQGNETKYSSFDEWFEKNGELYREPTSDERYLFEAGAASRQDEVSKLQIEIDELQKRIRLALGALGASESTPYWGRSGNCELAISILKNTEE